VTDMRDELLDRVVDELQTLPPVDEAAVRRIVSAAAAAAETRVEGGGQRAAGLQPWWRFSVPLAAAAGFAAAAGLGGFLAGDFAQRRPMPAAPTVSQPAAESLRLATASTAAALRPPPATLPTQFVLDAPSASRVALIGDFNAWNANETPLVRDTSSGIWTVTVRLAPGRHVYAFMVDGATWMLDPRAPTAQDPEFGTPSSVVLVGTP
jgi:hypothetical protein